MRGGSKLTRIRIPRQADLDTVEGLCRHRGATDVAQPFQQPDAQAGAGQVAGCHQAVVSAADNDDIDGVEIPRVGTTRAGHFQPR